MSVVSIHGDMTPYSGEPRPGLVTELERLLEMARSGELQGAGFVLLYRDRSNTYGWTGLAGTYGMVGAASMLVDDLKAAARGEP